MGSEMCIRDRGTLVTVALTGSLLQAGLDRGVEYADAYNGVIVVLGAAAAVFCAATAVCFRGNPKSGGIRA